MEVKACRRCHRLFNYLSGQRICPQCKKELEKKFLDVKEYVREHPKDGIMKVSEETEVSVPQILQWVKEERLQFAENSEFVLSCEHCGTQIFTGRFCKDCKKNLASGLTEAFSGDHVGLEKKHSTGMHYKAGSDKKKR